MFFENIFVVNSYRYLFNIQIFYSSCYINLTVLIKRVQFAIPIPDSFSTNPLKSKNYFFLYLLRVGPFKILTFSLPATGWPF